MILKRFKDDGIIFRRRAETPQDIGTGSDIIKTEDESEGEGHMKGIAN